MKKYKLIIIIAIGSSIFLVTAWKLQQLSKTKIALKNEIMKTTDVAQSSLETMIKLSKEKSVFTKNFLNSNPKNLSLIKNDLLILENSTLKTQAEFSQWENSLSKVNNLVAEYLIQELKISKNNSNTKNVNSIDNLVKVIEHQDQEIDSTIKNYAILRNKRNQLIENWKQIPFSKNEAFLTLPNSPLYEQMLQRPTILQK